MEPSSPTQLVKTLRRPGLRTRTGIWAISSELLGYEADEAVRLGIGSIDLRKELLRQLPEGAEYVPLDSDRMLQLIDAVATRKDLGDCVLIYSLDLLLARLSYQQRTDFWQFAFQGLAYRPCALLFGMPATATSLLPAGDTLTMWMQGGRFASTS